jgi:hypothetical protein
MTSVSMLFIPPVSGGRHTPGFFRVVKADTV